jgi:hypothetical protein
MFYAPSTILTSSSVNPYILHQAVDFDSLFWVVSFGCGHGMQFRGVKGRKIDMNTLSHSQRIINNPLSTQPFQSIVHYFSSEPSPLSRSSAATSWFCTCWFREAHS